MVKKIKELSIFFICLFFLFISTSVLCLYLLKNGFNYIGIQKNISSLSESNSVAYEWNQTWGGNLNDECFDLTNDSLGNLYLVGYTKSFGDGGSDICLVKFDSSGNVLWFRTWGGTGNDYGYAIALDSFNNVYVVGSIGNKSNEQDQDLCIIKYSNYGYRLWNQTLDDNSSSFTGDIIIDSSNNVYIIGNKLLIKYNNISKQLWNKTIWGSHNRIAVDSSDNIYVMENNYKIIYLQKYNDSGITEWSIECEKSGRINGLDLVVDSSNNIYITGYISKTDFDDFHRDLFLIKFNSSGNEEWYKTWGKVYLGKNFNNEEGRVIVVDNLNNTYVGHTYGLLKYNQSGALEWSKSWSGAVISGMTVLSAENIYLAGYTRYFTTGGIDICLIKYGIDSDGDDLSDLQENNVYLTDPNNPDTDGDELTDWEELILFLTDPFNPDTDGDGFSDGLEIFLRIDPLSAEVNPLFNILIICIPIGIDVIGIIIINKYKDVLLFWKNSIKVKKKIKKDV